MKVLVSDLEAAVARRLADLGVDHDHASLVTRSLIDADQRGVSSHGTARLPMYVDAIESGSIDPGSRPEIVSDSPAASLWNGKSSFGQVAAAMVVDHAITRAGEVGAHVGVCNDTNHFGTAGFWARRAAAEGCLGMAFCTSHPLVVPTRGTQAELGTNPISLALQGKTDEFVLDMATSTAALGKVEVRLRENREIPEGWAIDSSGDPVRDPAAVYPDVLRGGVGGLLPLGGGDETTGGHKGYGLGALVEILCAVLGGGSDLTPGRPLADRTAGLWPVSISFIVIDPAHLAGRDRTAESVDELTNALRRTPPVDPAKPVLVPGDIERENAERQAVEVEIDDTVWAEIVK